MTALRTAFVILAAVVIAGCVSKTPAPASAASSRSSASSSRDAVAASSVAAAATLYLELVAPVNAAHTNVEQGLDGGVESNQTELIAKIEAERGALRTFDAALRSHSWPAAAVGDVAKLAAANDVLVTDYARLEQAVRTYGTIPSSLEGDSAIADHAAAAVRSELGLPVPPAPAR